jgi:hypothetical protein
VTCLNYLFPISCPSCPILAVLSRLSCPGCPVQAVLSRRPVLVYAVPADLSFLCILSSLSCSGCTCTLQYYPDHPVQQLCPSCLFLAVHCPGCPVSAVLYRRSCFGCPFWLSGPGCPVWAVLSGLSCPGCPVWAVLSGLSCPGCPVWAALSWLSCLNHCMSLHLLSAYY